MEQNKGPEEPPKKNDNWQWGLLMLGLGSLAAVFYFYILKPRTTSWADDSSPVSGPGAGGGGEQTPSTGNSQCKVFQNAAADTKCKDGCCNERGNCLQNKSCPGWIGTAPDNTCSNIGRDGCYKVLIPGNHVSSCSGWSCDEEGSICLEGSSGASDGTYICKNKEWTMYKKGQGGITAPTCANPGDVLYEPQRHGPTMHMCCPTNMNNNRWVKMASNLQTPNVTSACCPTVSVTGGPGFGYGSDPADPGCTSEKSGSVKLTDHFSRPMGMGARPPLYISTDQSVCVNIGGGSSWKDVTGPGLSDNNDGFIFTGCLDGVAPS